jgi:hypothetical protein
MYFMALPVVALGSLSLVGCGPSSGLRTVKGKFKAEMEDGTRLQPQSILSLVPASGPADYKVSALSEAANGEYTLTTSYQENSLSGAPPGKYKVVIRGSMAPPAGAKSSSGGVHPDCADEKTTPLSIEIAESGTVTPDPLKIPIAK